jgi:hypothetical protein
MGESRFLDSDDLRQIPASSTSDSDREVLQTAFPRMPDVRQIAPDYSMTGANSCPAVLFDPSLLDGKLALTMAICHYGSA